MRAKTGNKSRVKSASRRHKKDWIARKPYVKRLKPKLTKSTITGPDPMHCGGFDWDVKWGLSPNSNQVNGWIVQKVRKVFYLWPCHPNQSLLTIRKSIPFWEAWQVRNGKIFIGNSNSPHQKDGFFQGMVGNSMRGRVLVEGTAELHENLSLPSTFIPNNPKTDAMSLPSTIKNPGTLPGGTGAIPHSIVIGWNCCPGRRRSRRKSKIIQTW